MSVIYCVLSYKFQSVKCQRTCDSPHPAGDSEVSFLNGLTLAVVYIIAPVVVHSCSSLKKENVLVDGSSGALIQVPSILIWTKLFENGGRGEFSHFIWNLELLLDLQHDCLRSGWTVKKMVKATIACCRVAFTLLPIVNLAKKANFDCETITDMTHWMMRAPKTRPAHKELTECCYRASAEKVMEWQMMARWCHHRTEKMRNCSVGWTLINCTSTEPCSTNQCMFLWRSWNCTSHTQHIHPWNIAIVDRSEIDKSGVLICSSIVQSELQMEAYFLKFNFNFKLKSLLSFLIQVLPVKSKDSGSAVYRWLSGCPSINCLSTTPWSLLFSLLL